MRGEISYDLVMDENMPFVEGTYRIDEGVWRVFIVSKRAELEERETERSTWDSGVTGVVIRFPRSAQLNKQSVERVMSEICGVERWDEVRGPDSMELR